MRSRLVAGNWKMNGSLAANRRLLEALKAGLQAKAGVRHSVCVPYPYLAQVEAALTGTPISWGAQNLSEHAQGAYTGEVSGAMLRDFGCYHVLVGHSERRALYGESDKQVAAKFQAAQGAGLIPILCLGESLQERESAVTEIVVGRQLAAVLETSGVGALANAVIAYEPVWAIGTGVTATSEQIAETHQRIKAITSKPLLYGGSVKPTNTAEILGINGVDGVLVGTASWESKSFCDMLTASKTVAKG